MAKAKFDVGDEVMIRATVTAVWADGQVTVQLAGPGHKVTFPADSDDIVALDSEPPPKPSGKRGRLV